MGESRESFFGLEGAGARGLGNGGAVTSACKQKKVSPSIRRPEATLRSPRVRVWQIGGLQPFGALPI